MSFKKIARGIRKVAALNPELRAELAPLYAMARVAAEDEGHILTDAEYKLLWKYTEGREPKGKGKFWSDKISDKEHKKEIRFLKGKLDDAYANIETYIELNEDLQRAIENAKKSGDSAAHEALKKIQGHVAQRKPSSGKSKK